MKRSAFPLVRGVWGFVRRVADSGCRAGLAEVVASIAVAVVGHDALGGDVMASEPSEGSAEEGDGTLFSSAKISV
jgi:hypothetical protein